MVAEDEVAEVDLDEVDLDEVAEAGDAVEALKRNHQQTTLTQKANARRRLLQKTLSAGHAVKRGTDLLTAPSNTSTLLDLKRTRPFTILQSNPSLLTTQ